MRVLAFSGGKDSMACLHLLRDSLDAAIYVDTGKSYPETQELVRYASTILPVVTVHTDQEAQNLREGIPAGVVPIDWTPFGQSVSGAKPALIQSYLNCCWENISIPLFQKAVDMGATEIVYGQRDDENHKSTARNGDMVHGLKRLHPLEDWTSEEVLTYLATKMEVPAHYSVSHSSLDCYDCTAYQKDSRDRVEFTRINHPEKYQKYAHRLDLLDQALVEALGW